VVELGDETVLAQLAGHARTRLQSEFPIQNGTVELRFANSRQPRSTSCLLAEAALDEHTPLLALLEQHWPDLQRASSRSYAIEGARVLGLIDLDGSLTPQGAVVADLLQGVGFATRSRPAKRLRLADAAPPVAAVARSVLLGQPAVSLVVETLRRRPAGSLGISELLAAASQRDEMLARALFLRDPERDLSKPLRPADFRSATVFQFKQILWHAGVSATKSLPGAGAGAANYQPALDVWQLDERILRSPSRLGP